MQQPGTPYGPALADEGRGATRIGAGIFVFLLIAALATGWILAELRLRDARAEPPAPPPTAAPVVAEPGACIRAVTHLEAVSERYREAVRGARAALRGAPDIAAALAALSVKLTPEERSYRDGELQTDLAACRGD